MSKSHYKKIKGNTYDRAMIEIADNAISQNPSGKISTKDAKAIYKAAIDGNVITDIEKATLEYIYTNYPFIKTAETYLKNEISNWLNQNKVTKKKPASQEEAKSNIDENVKLKSELKSEIEKDLEAKLKPALKEQLKVELDSSLEPNRIATEKLISEKSKLSFGEKEELKSEIQQNLKTSISSEVRYNLKPELKSEILDELKFTNSSTEKENNKIPIALLILFILIVILQIEICYLKDSDSGVKKAQVTSETNKPKDSIEKDSNKKEPNKTNDKDSPSELQEDIKTIESIRIPFVKDSYYVTSQEAEQSLRKLVALLRKNPELRIKVIGYTCNKGDIKLNKAVSLSRAKTIAQLLKNVGIEGSRMEVIGAADLNPIADNSTQEGREKNRRVQIKVIP